MAFPTIPTRETVRKQVFVAKIGGTVLGQVRSFTVNETVNTQEESRISDTSRFETREDKNSRVSFDIYLQTDMSEFALLMGGDTLPATGGWVSGDTVSLDPDTTKFDMTIEMYDSQSAGSLMGYWDLQEYAPISNNFTVGGDTGSVTATCEGVVDSLIYYPSVGVGG